MKLTNVFAFIAAVLLPLSAAAQVVSTISGRVVSSANRQPVAGATVEVDRGDSATTDADGNFLLTNVPPGERIVRVRGARFAEVTVPLRIGSAATAPMLVTVPSDVVREEITVSASTVGELGLTRESTTASRLGLNAIDVPASIDMVDSSVMNARGYQKVSDAVSRMPGVVVGEHGTAPSTFVIRGFTPSQTTILRDGIWLGPSTMVMRPQNTFNLDRIELLRGPGSAVNGQGAVAGTVNAVTRSADVIDALHIDGLLSYGSFGTYHVGAGVAGPATGSLWYRFDVSRSGSDGYVERMDSGSTNAVGSLFWRPTLRTRFRVSVDYLDDDLAKYFGTPLLPRSAASRPLNVIESDADEVVDQRTRFVNYNVGDAVAESQQLLLRSDFEWSITDDITLSNVLYGFRADRRWRNAEGYVYCRQIGGACTEIGEVQRYNGYFRIDHDQDVAGDRLTLQVNRTLVGRENRMIAGVEATSLDFTRTRGFRIAVPQTPDDSVDLLDPEPGRYGREEIRGVSPTSIDTVAAFVEDAFSLTPRLRVTGALRHERLNLVRVNLNANGSIAAGGFERSYDWLGWRAGTVFELVDGFVAYGQYSNAKDPVSSNIFLVNAHQNFDLTEARQWEVGLKSARRAGAQWTLAWFDIERDDVLERFAVDSATNIGGITSRGVEATSTFRFGEHTSLGANAGYTDSAYRASANFVRFAGNRPPNVPTLTANVWASRANIAGLPLELGASARYVSDRYANNANTITLKSYTLGDVYAAWNVGGVRITTKIDNVTDEVYASWSDVAYLGRNDPSFVYAHQLMLGAPRAFSVMLQKAF